MKSHTRENRIAGGSLTAGRFGVIMAQTVGKLFRRPIAVMKRILAILLLLALCLPLCACGKKRAEEVPAAPEPIETVTPVQSARSYHTQEITPDNWDLFFEISEIPLYTVTTFGEEKIISQVCENYCVVLKDDYLPYLNPDGDYSVRFELSFDLYVDTLEIDTLHFTYRHTDDRLFAVNAVKTAVFNRAALPKSAYGTEYGRRVGYANNFFTGWAAMQPDSKVWAGFYIDLSSVQLISVQGSVELSN